MPGGAVANRATFGRAGIPSADLRRDLLATLELGTALEGSRSTTTPLDKLLGPLAGLLIAKWASYDESEREAIAAFNEEAFTQELPEALRLSTWSDPTGSHAGEVAEALGTMAARNGAGSAAVRCAVHVAPLVTHTAERSRPTYEWLYACVRRIDMGTPDGRTLAARLFDDVLHTVMARQGSLVGEFATPNQVATLMLELADPQPGDRVYDPCFGFGEVLVGAARRLQEAARTAPPRVWAGIRQAGIFGIEINRISYAVGLCRILLAGIDRPGLELSDALERPLPRSRSGDGFDCIMAVPPWGMRTSHVPAGQFPFPNRNLESLFLQHVMANLRPGGRAVVALPEGPLFRHGSDQQMRKALLSDYSVDAVASLPVGTFAPWTGIPVNLVVFRRDEPRPAVRFISIPPDTWKTAPEVHDSHIRTRSSELFRCVADLSRRRPRRTGGCTPVPCRDMGCPDPQARRSRLRAGCPEIGKRCAGCRDRSARRRGPIAEDPAAGASRGSPYRAVVSNSTHDRASRRSGCGCRPDSGRGREGHRRCKGFRGRCHAGCLDRGSPEAFSVPHRRRHGQAGRESDPSSSGYRRHDIGYRRKGRLLSGPGRWFRSG